VCGRVLQCVAVCCSVLQFINGFCHALVAPVFVHCSVFCECVAVSCSQLQRVAVCCGVLQCIALCYNTLQHTATL